MKYVIAIWTLLFSVNLFAQTVVLRWGSNPGAGQITVVNGELEKINSRGGKIQKNRFDLSSAANKELWLTVGKAQNEVGPKATVVNVLMDNEKSFSFFLRDVSSGYPIYIPAYGVTVLPRGDNRSYAQVEHDVLSRKRFTKIEKIEEEPEMSFQLAASAVRKMNVPIWLGLGRDMRIFEVEDELETNSLECKALRPRYSGTPVTLPESNNQGVFYRYAIGRGVGIKNNVKRSLEDGALPIYHSEMRDDDIKYHSITFASLSGTELSEENVVGTDYFISDKYSPGRVFTNEQKVILEKKLANQLMDMQEVVLCSKTCAENVGNVPRYAWLKTPQTGNGNWKYVFDTNTGFSAFSKDRVFCVSKLNGKPIPNEEMAVLLQPGEKVDFEFYLFHTPVTWEKAETMADISFESKYRECKAYWKGKLGRAAQIEVPETRINNMIKSGLLHLDLITFGQQPNGPLATNVGIYSPIGTESAPIMQFYMSMGWEDEAKRALTYFLETQQENGLIANYSGYMVETGAVLWSIGEYYRYTKDKKWLMEIMPKIKKSCNYLIDWRNNNKKEELKGRGYGMIDGKVADPEDNFHQFMLNGYAYMGLSRMGEVLKSLDIIEADFYRKEADNWKKDIRSSLVASMSLSPVVPLGDGTWCPTAPPWAEGNGPRALYQDLGTFWSHGTFTIADGLLGPLYLIYCEVLEPSETVAKMLYHYHSELFYQGNSGFSQPYYSTHNWYQAKMGLTKPFLNTYYTTMAATADRETYSFWEHLYKMTPHKTHEEANFLMDTRRMLYMENKDTLEIFKVIPRNWLENGKKISLHNVRSYFGKLEVSAVSSISSRVIEASVECHSNKIPVCVKIRLPHPGNKVPIKVEGGCYDEKSETVIIMPFDGQSVVRLTF